MGRSAARLRLAAPSARRGLDHHARQRARAGRRVDRAAGHARQHRRLAARSGGAPHHLVAQPGAAGAARRRHEVLPALPAQSDAPGALSAPHRERDARRRAAPAGGRGADLCGAVHAGAGAHAQVGHAQAVRRARPAGAARRRTREPQSGRADRVAARPVAAAPGLRGAQRAAAARAQQRDRPHDADAALLPPRRRQFRAVQRHGADAQRAGLDRARL